MWVDVPHRSGARSDVAWLPHAAAACCCTFRRHIQRRGRRLHRPRTPFDPHAAPSAGACRHATAAQLVSADVLSQPLVRGVDCYTREHRSKWHPANCKLQLALSQKNGGSA
eukprot:328325-Chlamydomonas_euryale.AAC.4